MAKMNVTVDNDLENVKLESSDKLKSKKEKEKNEKKREKKGKPGKKGSYLAEVGKEMRLVTWPSRKDVVKYSIATILMIIFLSMFFIFISALFDLLYGLVQGWIG